MSKAYKCDICGDLFTDRIAISLNDNKNAYLKICDHVYDVCPGCINAIEKVVNDRKPSNNADSVTVRSCYTCKHDPFENYPCPLKEVCGKDHNNWEAKE